MTCAASSATPLEAVSSTSTLPGLRSAADWLASLPPETVETFLAGLSPNALGSLPYLWEMWAFPHQLPPEGTWRTWVILGGRGAGKTRAGAEWVRAMVEGATPEAPGEARRVALVGETLDQAREVMVMGESGILAVSPPDRRPVWEASRRRLVWPNGAVAQVYSAHDPDSLRGPQFDAAWVDELAKWPKAEAAWDMLQFALRLGRQPRQVVTTTPQPVPVLKAILGRDSTVLTHAPTEANRAYLARSFLAEVTARYAGQRLGRQELQGELIEDVEGALWTQAMLDRARAADVTTPERIVVAVDPPVSGKGTSDACGIVVAGVRMHGTRADWRAVVLEDGTVEAASPGQWAEKVVELARGWGAAKVVAEVNQGGDLVSEVLRSVDPLLPVQQVRARQGKAARAEPIAALYEQGRVAHVAGLDALEAQMAQMTVQGFTGSGSPDRVDALVWALHALMIAPAQHIGQAPRMRML